MPGTVQPAQVMCLLAVEPAKTMILVITILLLVLMPGRLIPHRPGTPLSGRPLALATHLVVVMSLLVRGRGGLTLPVWVIRFLVLKWPVPIPAVALIRFLEPTPALLILKAAIIRFLEHTPALPTLPVIIMYLLANTPDQVLLPGIPILFWARALVI